jgi:hypothetical protein
MLSRFAIPYRGEEEESIGNDRQSIGSEYGTCNGKGQWL